MKGSIIKSDHAADGRRPLRRIVMRSTSAGLAGAAVHVVLSGSLLGGRTSQSSVAATPAG